MTIASPSLHLYDKGTGQSFPPVLPIFHRNDVTTSTSEKEREREIHRYSFVLSSLQPNSYDNTDRPNSSISYRELRRIDHRLFIQTPSKARSISSTSLTIGYRKYTSTYYRLPVEHCPFLILRSTRFNK